MRAWLVRIGPVLARLEHHIDIRAVGRHGIDRNLRRAGAGEDFLDLRHLFQPLLHRRLQCDSLRQAHAHSPDGLDRDVPFVQIGDELATQPCGEPTTGQHQHHGSGEEDDTGLEREAQQRLVATARGREDDVVLLLDRPTEQQGHARRHEGDGEEQRGGERHHHGLRHRVEHLSLHTFQRKDRQIHRRDDEHAEQAGANHFRRGVIDRIHALAEAERALLRTLLREPAQAVLDDDDRAIHDETEVQRAQTHQVCGNPRLHHAGDGHQHGERNHQRGEQCRAQVAQQQEQDHHHQQRTFDEVLLDGGDGLIHQHGAVVSGDGLHAFGQ